MLSFYKKDVTLADSFLCMPVGVHSWLGTVQLCTVGYWATVWLAVTKLLMTWLQAWEASKSLPLAFLQISNTGSSFSGLLPVILRGHFSFGLELPKVSMRVQFCGVDTEVCFSLPLVSSRIWAALEVSTDPVFLLGNSLKNTTVNFECQGLTLLVSNVELLWCCVGAEVTCQQVHLHAPLFIRKLGCPDCIQE